MLHGATRLEGAPRGGVLLCYGDSITQGYDALHPSLGYAAVLARSLGLDLLNQAISGYVFDPATIDAAHVPAPRRIIVAYGTNDWTNKGSLAEVRGDMDRYLDALVGAFPGCPIDLILPIWRGDCGEMTAVGSFPEVLEELAASVSPLSQHPRPQRPAGRPPLRRLLRRRAAPPQRHGDAAVRPVAGGQNFRGFPLRIVISGRNITNCCVIYKKRPPPG